MSRKPNDASGVFEKYPGSGIWYIRFRANGKNIRRKVGDRIEAEKALAAVQLSKKTSQPIVNLNARGATMNRLCEIYLEAVENPDNPNQPKDLYNLRARVNVIREKFGSRVASTIQASEIRQWLISMKRSPATLNRYRSVLSSIYRHGKEEGFVSVNPVRDLRQFRTELPTPRWLREDEEARIRKVLQGWIESATGISKLYLRCHPHELTFALETGLRKSNQYGLEIAKHIDLQMRYIRLPASMTKTGKPLDLPMSRKVIEALEEMKQIRAEIAEYKTEHKTGANEKRMIDDGRVFLIRENREWWKSALQEAGIKDLRWHDLRHTFATRLVQRGIHLSIVQKLCGHRSMSTTTRYAHAADDQMRNAIDSL